jgi:hypothetical protein
MTLEVELDRLLEVAAGFGTVPMLLSTDDDTRPRAAATALTWDGVHATCRVGRRTLANASIRPLVSLLWPAPPGQRFALLVDGRVSVATPDADPREGGWVSVLATRAILHVVDRPAAAGRPEGGPTSQR